jgi:hypothetical protein
MYQALGGKRSARPGYTGIAGTTDPRDALLAALNQRKLSIKTPETDHVLVQIRSQMEGDGSTTNNLILQSRNTGTQESKPIKPERLGTIGEPTKFPAHNSGDRRSDALTGRGSAPGAAETILDPRSRLMAAIAKKNATLSSDAMRVYVPEAKPVTTSGEAGADPQSKLLAAIAKKNAAASNGAEDVAPVYMPEAKPVTTSGEAGADPRSKLLAAIAKKNAAASNGAEDVTRAHDILPQPAAVESVEDPRSKLLAAMAKRNAARDVETGVGDGGTVADPRQALLGALNKKKQACEEAARVEVPTTSAATPTACLKEDAKYGKFFKMMKVGLPQDAVAHKMISEGAVDSHAEAMVLLSMDPNGPPPAAKKAAVASESAPLILLKDDPKYSKFLKMLKVGLPIGAAAQKLFQEGSALSYDEAYKILEMDPNGPSPSCLQTLEAPAASQISYKDHPVYSKYFKMIKVGLPAESVKAKMQVEGVDPSILDKNPEEMVPAEASAAQKVAAKDHPSYAKFFKMLKVGTPIEAVRLKMRAECLDVTFIDRSPDELIPLEAETEQLVPLTDHPVYAKYFRMLKVGTPKEAVKIKMKQEGANEAYLDKEPSDLVPLAIKAPVTNMKKMIAPQVRKKKLHWKTVDAAKISADSLWRQSSAEDFVEIDTAEFETLFVEKTDASKKSGGEKEKEKEKPAKQAKVSLLDAKRAQNAGIALARVKMSFEDVRKVIADMNDKAFDTEPLKNLGEYLPTDEEARLLMAYKGDKALLGQAEKYMMTMLNFKTAKKRLDCMVFKKEFKDKLSEIKATVAVIVKACEQVRNSARMKKVLKCILKVGNQMNDGAENIGFSLETLLKLSAAKAFDKKTSVLQYVIMLIFRNEENCLYFPTDLECVAEASRLMLDQVEADRTGLKNSLDETVRNFKEIQNDPDVEASEANQSAVEAFLSKVRYVHAFSPQFMSY